MKVLTVQDILAFKRKHELVIKQRIRVGWEKLRAPCVQVEDCLRATSAEIVLTLVLTTSGAWQNVHLGPNSQAKT